MPVVIDRLTGEGRTAQICIAVLGASSFTCAQATWTQAPADWISGHVGAFEAIGGVTAIVRNNTKVTVIKACRRSGDQRSYADIGRNTAPPFCRPGHDGNGIRPRSRRRSSWLSSGCSGGCGT
ncbi:transposase [Bradyrhizobium sp. GM0.4]